MYIAIDFDGTCVDHKYPQVGSDAPGAVDTLKELIKADHKLILWTMRSGAQLQDAIDWFSKNNIMLFGIQTNPTQSSWTSSPKCYANIYIDDASLGAPLIKIDTFNRPCIDWNKVREYFSLPVLNQNVYQNPVIKW